MNKRIKPGDLITNRFCTYADNGNKIERGSIGIFLQYIENYNWLCTVVFPEGIIAVIDDQNFYLVSNVNGDQ